MGKLIAIVGRPNVGKSTLFNRLTQTRTAIVDDTSGTTRESIYKRYSKFGFHLYLVDTAGLRIKTKVNEDLEYFSVIR